MVPANEPLSASILAIMYFGDVVFAVSGALTAARYKMDVLGFVLIGTITGIGGGTIRNLLLDIPIWWMNEPFELYLCMAASLLTFFFISSKVIRSDITRKKWMVWSDALGLASFGVVGCHIALASGVPFFIAVFMGMVTATGGGIVRDILTNTQPMILCGQPYATVGLLGALTYACLYYLGVTEVVSEVLAFMAAFTLRASAIIFNIRMGPPGEFIRLGKDDTSNK